MKKITLIILSLILIVAVAGCNLMEPIERSSKNLKPEKSAVQGDQNPANPSTSGVQQTNAPLPAKTPPADADPTSQPDPADPTTESQASAETTEAAPKTTAPAVTAAATTPATAAATPTTASVTAAPKTTAAGTTVAQVTPTTTAPKNPVSGKNKMVALTFDDGPYTAVTTKILDAFKQYGGKGTFFVVGNRIDNYAAVLKRTAAEGHEIGNHTFSHPQLTKLSADGIRAELKKTDDKVVALTGVKPRIIRPTYGAVNDRVKATVDRPLINWSVDTLDWKFRNANTVYNKIMNGLGDGDIVLMHDIHPTTGEAAVRAIRDLNARGYKLVTVSELLAARGVGATPGKLINSARR